MKTSPTASLIIVIVLLIVAGGLYFALAPKAKAPATSATTETIATTSPSTSLATSSVAMKSYTDRGQTFSLSYPETFTFVGKDDGFAHYAQGWLQSAATLGSVLVRITVPSSFEPKTNFVDATFGVGSSADRDAIAQCLMAPQSSGPVLPKTTVTIHGVEYTKFISSDAGAGNVYENTSYRTVRNGQCYGVEYTIHSSNIGNYSRDQGITAFDQAKIHAALEGIVQSFKFL
ncbi:hypothetical protein H0X32_01995 [Patescibacteria group bacterium]|nr:hypothetical protein [Patescibacteria group bacterium]